MRQDTTARRTTAHIAEMMETKDYRTQKIRSGQELARHVVD
jgi:hypothetical protein